MKESKDQVIEAQMKVGAQIQKFYTVMCDYADELKRWQPIDENEVELKRSKEDILYSLMDDYNLLFDNILE